MRKILSIILTITILLGVVVAVPFSASAEVTLDDNKVYIKCDGEYYEVEKGSAYTYEYCLKVSDSNVTGLDATTYYDADGLQFVPHKLTDNSDDEEKMFPVFKDVVLNYNDAGMVFYNYCTAEGESFRKDNTVVFRGDFLVTADRGVYEIVTMLKTLTDYEMDILAYNFEKLGKYEEGGSMPQLTPVEETTTPPTEPPTSAPTQAPTMNPNDTWTVAGEQGLCGNAWQMPPSSSNYMTYNAQTDRYEKVYTNIAQGTYEFKVINGTTWSVPNYNLDGQANSSGNAKVTVAKNGSTVIISTDGTKAYVEVIEVATEAPTVAPTVAPTQAPTQRPTQGPTQPPTAEPTEAPTVAPTVAPTQGPTQKPTVEPTVVPTEAPTVAPTQAPTQRPTQGPTQPPTAEPTEAPTQPVTEAPTVAPTQGPTQLPTAEPTEAPTDAPTEVETESPTEKPTEKPSVAPTVPTQPQIIIGDADEDGVINIFDATEIQLYLAKYKVLSETQMIAADADKDGIVNIFDVTRIQLYLAKYITEF